MRKAMRMLSVAAGGFSLAVLIVSLMLAGMLPDHFYTASDGELVLESSFNKVVGAEKNNEASMRAEANIRRGDYEVDLKLLGMVPIKTAHVKTVERQYMVPCGTPFGVKIYTAGVIVVGMTAVDTVNGMSNPAKNAGIKEGDAILSINGKKVDTTEDVAKSFENCNGDPMNVEIQRGTSVFTVKFTPLLSASQKIYKAGLWVRDSSAGIGTMTFYNPQTGIFAGLGHAVCDVDTGEILPLMSGAVVGATITGCNRGRNGNPGELCGFFHNSNVLGDLKINGETGVYGQSKTVISSNEALPVAMKQEISEGAAQIITTIDTDGPQTYDIEIVKIYYNSSSHQKNMVIKVTDGELLEKTGGIVQGMSGSPIIQNGMLVGAVTHVFVNNSAQGYGIFAENMMNTANSLYQSLINNAA